MELTLNVQPIARAEATGFLGSIEHKRGERLHRVSFKRGFMPTYQRDSQRLPLDDVPVTISRAITKQALALGWL